MKTTINIFLAASFFAVASLAHATVTLSNLSQELQAATPISSSLSYSSVPVSYVAQSFITGTTSQDHWQLNSLQLLLDLPGGSPTGTFSVAIYSNNSNQPGSLVGSFTGNTNPAPDSPTVFTYNADGVINLSVSTQYWIVCSAPTTSDGAYSWDVVATSFDTQAPGWSVDADHSFAASADGSDWGTLWSQAENGGNQAFSLDVVAVPEPTACALLACATIPLVRCFRARRA